MSGSFAQYQSRGCSCQASRSSLARTVDNPQPVGDMFRQLEPWRVPELDMVESYLNRSAAAVPS